MGSKRLLNKEQIADYNKSWGDFKHKNDLETEYNVHSSRPVISKIMLYDGYEHPILRAKINQKKLREFDPYFKFDKYANPFWHLQHYIMVSEQMYHAGSNLIRDNSKLVVKDTIEEFRISRPIFWRNSSKHVSIELMLKKNDKTGPFLFVEDAYVSFYNEKTNRELGGMHVKTYANFRSYIRDINTIQDSKSESEINTAREGLIRKIESQDFKQNKIAKIPRNNIVPGLYLIDEIKKGNLPKEEIINYFSLWEPSRN